MTTSILSNLLAWPYNLLDSDGGKDLSKGFYGDKYNLHTWSVDGGVWYEAKNDFDHGRGGDPEKYIDGHFDGHRAYHYKIEDHKGELIVGTDGDDHISGGWDDDLIYGRDGNDVIDGKSDDDIIYGGNGHDHLKGGHGDDRLDGGHGNDRLYGNSGHDKLVGGNGNDKLDGGKGNDVLTGGGGHDTFVFGRYDGHDVITDFDAHDDMLTFDDSKWWSKADFHDLHLSQKGHDVLIEFGYSDVLLKDVDLHDLNAHNFDFT